MAKPRSVVLDYAVYLAVRLAVTPVGSERPERVDSAEGTAVLVDLVGVTGDGQARPQGQLSAIGGGETSRSTVRLPSR